MDELDKIALLGIVFWIGLIMYSFSSGYAPEHIIVKRDNLESIEDLIINE